MQPMSAGSTPCKTAPSLASFAFSADADPEEKPGWLVPKTDPQGSRRGRLLRSARNDMRGGVPRFRSTPAARGRGGVPGEVEKKLGFRKAIGGRYVLDRCNCATGLWSSEARAT